MNKKVSSILILLLSLSLNLWAQAEQKKGRNPVIVIPGILGSKLVNQKNGEIAWVRFSQAKSDDLRLPISDNLAENRDNLVAAGIVDTVKVVRFLPGVSVYRDLLDYLEKKAGYREAKWDSPRPGDERDTYFVFSYDWRRDNVETARLLIQKVESLKAKLKKPDLKFDVLSHSMGGLVARYAAMYGTADLAENQLPDWSGKQHFNRVFMLGTPNEGSMGALDTFYHGYWLETFGNRYYPDFLKREVAFTIPSLYQLLPHGQTAKFYDDNLKPAELNIYDSRVWKKYGWTVLADPLYLARLKKTERFQAEKYFEAVLQRARLFHQALDAKTTVPDSLTFYAYGSDCKTTLEGAVVYFDTEQGEWTTLTESDSFKNLKGEKISEKSVRQTIYAKGDGSVTKTSLLGESLTRLNGQNLFLNVLSDSNQKIFCEDHTSMPGNKKLQESLLEILSGGVTGKNSRKSKQ